VNMNTSLVTTGITPVAVGSMQVFQASPVLNGQPWDLTGGSANLLMTDPVGGTYDIIATVIGFGAAASFTIPNVVGSWVRAWKLTDATGLVEYSLPITMNVVASPGVPF